MQVPKILDSNTAIKKESVFNSKEIMYIDSIKQNRINNMLLKRVIKKFYSQGKRKLNIEQFFDNSLTMHIVLNSYQ